MMKRRVPTQVPRSRKIVGALLALGLIVAACGGADEAPAEDATATPAPAPAPAEEAPGEPGRTTLELNYFEEPPNLIPTEGSTQGRRAFLTVMMLPLVETNENGEIISRILESWEYSADGTSVTMVLQDGIEWSDGTPLTAADVHFTLERLLDAQYSAWAVRFGGVVGQAAYGDGSADEIEGLVLIDDRTLRVDLVGPDAAWVANIATNALNTPTLPSHILGGTRGEEFQQHEYFSPRGGFSVVSGAFSLVEWRENEYAEFVRNDNYSHGTPYFERVFMKLLTSDVAAAQFEAGEIQFLFRISPDDAGRIGNLPGAELRSSPGVAPELWSIMHDDGEIDVRVRQAMLYALDREALCEQALQGFCSVPLTNIRLVGEGTAWAVPDGLIEYRYDPDRARELLAEAEADGAWDPNTTLIFNHRPGISYTDTAIQIAQGQMAAVGINWQIDNVDTATLISNIREAPLGTIDGFWVSGADFSADPSSAQTYYECATARTGANLISYCHPELDEFWAAGRATADRAERAEAYHAAYRFMNENPASIYLYVLDTIYAFDERLKGVKGHQNVTGLFWDIADWYWEE